MTRILIIEDDRDINDILNSLLTNAGYTTMRAFNGAEARPLMQQDPDLILMDLMLPDTTGEELLTELQDRNRNRNKKTIPVIAVSARSTVEDKVDLLKLGCVDYVTKPFDNNELLARIEVALKFKNGSAGKEQQTVTLGNLTMDDAAHTISVDNTPARLTPTEYAIIKVLLVNRDRVISKTELIEEANKITPDLVEESLKVHMSNLRRKLKSAGSNVEIEAVWGIGFRLTVTG
ncbi:DNA-binding response regulator, OmpR family, contains REC and winged-helix (wHTH) domain [Ruminococcaceae bacterium YRB3002]|nr:DNA-binding response regulator, OmpR family, contains REC and winged-helix (wHTH) domain [Ruminococcaceae bacterium YRB3002]